MTPVIHEPHEQMNLGGDQYVSVAYDHHLPATICDHKQRSHADLVQRAQVLQELLSLGLAIFKTHQT